MPEKRCSLGFSCASMMMFPGLDPGDCDNYEACKEAAKLMPRQNFELTRVSEIDDPELRETQRLRYERIRVNRHSCALMMLLDRGDPQSIESLGIAELMNQINSLMPAIQTALNHYSNYYIAPEKVEAHSYNVKRPRGVYSYNKLASPNAIFEPAERDAKVKVIHLSHDDDPRNLEARQGIERRNKLSQARTQLQIAQAALMQALNLIAGSSGITIEEARTAATREELTTE